ncbi:UDP-N-acetylmuramate dehydrogenase [Patescibacteria group bacterium]
MSDDIEIQKNIDLAEHSYLKVGGTAEQFCVANNFDQLQDAMVLAKEKKWPTVIVGQASNLIFADGVYKGLVIKISGGEPSIIKRNKKSVILEVFAGYPMTALARYAAENSLSGLEWAYGLPGTVGGAVRGNAGCYDGETKDVMTEVDVLDTKDPTQTTTYQNPECKFAYRESIFKKSPQLIIANVRMQLTPGNADQIKKDQNEIISKRNAKFPRQPNTGSFFKNIDLHTLDQARIAAIEDLIGDKAQDSVPTGLIIDKLGLKGLKCGSAQVSDEHANILVNIENNAKSKDFVCLMEKIQSIVQEKIGINLEPEVQIMDWSN